MRRLVNFRAPLFIAIGIILGILSFYEYLFGNFWFGIAATVLLVALFVTLIIVKSKSCIGVFAVMLALIFGFGISCIAYNLLSKNTVSEKSVTISGRVSDMLRNGTDSATVYLEDCVDSEGVEYKGRIQTYIFDYKVETGDIVTVYGKLNSVYPIKGNVEAYYLRSNIRYDLQTEYVVSHNSGKLKVDETVRKYIYDVSSEYAPRNGDVLYALLTGDRSALSSEKESYFKLAGVIHLLAVSGLHVGFIVALFVFILKRFKLHPLIECGILLIPLIFYAYVCNFTPSIIRAIVMLVCSYVARAVWGRYDLLNSLSLAVIVIVCISPFNVFDLGFQLSALSVYGIATTYLTINRLLSKHKIHKVLKYFINSLSVSLSCSIATFFTLQLNYGYAPLLGILLNIVVIPLVTVVFVLGFVSMLPWVFHYVLFAVDWILELVVIVAKWVAGLSFGTVSINAVSVTVAVVVLWLFVLGGYVNLRKIGKIVAHSTLACAVALCVGLSFVKYRPQTQAFVVYGYDDVMCVVTSNNGKAAIVGNFSDLHAYAYAVNFLSRYKIDECTVFITDYSDTKDVIIADALEHLPVSAAYKLDFAYNAAVDAVFDNRNVTLYQQMVNTSSGSDVQITSVYDGGLRAVVMRSDMLTATVVYGNDYAVANYLNNGISSDIYVLPCANETYSTNQLTTLSMYQSDLPFNYGANKYGNFTITQKGGTISIKFR